MRAEFLACGLTETEYDVFHHLLTRGARSAGVIAKTLGIAVRYETAATELIRENGRISGVIAEANGETFEWSQGERKI